MVQHRKINVIHHINIMKGRNYMIILIDAEKAFDKIQYLLWLKKKRNLKLEVEGYFFNPRAIYEKSIANILLNGERQSLFPKIRNETKMPAFVTFVQQRLPRWLNDKDPPAKQEMWVQSLSPIHGLGRSPGEGNGNPLQCSCLENPRDGGAWWAAVYGVTQNRTRLKRLSGGSNQNIPSFLCFFN